MSEQPTPAAEGKPPVDLRADLTADPVVLASGVLVLAGLLLLVLGVAGSWHWRAAIWGAVVASVAAFALVAYAATARRTEFPADAADDAAGATGSAGSAAGEARPERVPGRRPVKDAQPPAPPTPDPAAAAKASAEAEGPPPRPRFAGFGKSKPAQSAPPVKPPPPQPTNVQVMHVQGSNVRVAPTPQPMPVSRPERPAARPPSTPPSTPPTIQVGLARDPGFPTYQPIDPAAPVIQVRNRYHRPDCRYVAVAAVADRVETTVGAARATNAMPCGVCRP